MLKFSPLTLTPEGDYSYTTELKLLKATTDSLHEKAFKTTGSIKACEKMATSEWSSYMRGNTCTYVQRSIAAWDNLTLGGAPVMAKPKMDECMALLKRFTDYLYNEKCSTCNDVCVYFDKMLPHLQYLLPPTTQESHALLKETLDQLTESCNAMKAAITGDGNILKVETEKASA